MWAAAVAVPTGGSLPPAPEVSDVQGRDEHPAAGQSMAEEDFSTFSTVTKAMFPALKTHNSPFPNQPVTN